MKPIIIKRMLATGSMTILFILMLSVAAAHAGAFDAYAKFMRDTSGHEGGLPDYTYFYTGRSHLPYAVIGVDPKFNINSRFWNRIDAKDGVTAKIDNLMPVPPFDKSVSRILDRNGTQIGIWFSYYPGTIVKFGKDDNLTVYSPYQPSRWAD